MKLTRATYRTEVALDRIGEVLKVLIRVQADEKVDDIDTLQYAYELHLVTTETNRAQHGLLLTDKGNHLLRETSAALLIGEYGDPDKSQPTHTVKLETDDLVEIKAMVDNGATLVIERGGGLSGLTLRGGGISYLVESTNGFVESRIEFADAYSFFNSGFTKGRQIYVDYPIPPTAGKASAKSKALEELDEAKGAIGPNTAISHIIKAIEALIEGAE